MNVMSLTMGTNLVQWSPLMNRTIDINNIMIADAIKPSLSMPSVNVCHRHIASFRCGRAMNNNKISSFGFRIQAV